MDPKTRCGPMVSANQQKSVLSYIRSGIEEGAVLVAGGPDLIDGLESGYFVWTTAFMNVKPHMKIWKEEIFGPVLSIASY